MKAVDVWDRILEQPGRAIVIPQFEGADVGAALDAYLETLAPHLAKPVKFIYPLRRRGIDRAYATDDGTSSRNLR